MQAEHPALVIRALGGTIAMQGDTGRSGVSPTLDAAALTDAVPALRRFGRIDAQNVCLIPGASLRLLDIFTLRHSLIRAATSGAMGAVVSQGTDTLEETAYSFSLMWDQSIPVVFTGAMRPADAIGADGPSNLLASAQVAMTPGMDRYGPVVVMNQEIHLPRWVRKSHTGRVDAFQSPGSGPIGWVQEDHPSLTQPPAPRQVLAIDDDKLDSVPRVALLPVSLGADADLLEWLSDRYDGLVIEAFGGGHVPRWWLDPIAAVADRMPTVIASRVPAGAVFRRTYDFPGSEISLGNAGAIFGGGLSGPKARLLLTLCLMASDNRALVQKTFSKFATSGIDIARLDDRNEA